MKTVRQRVLEFVQRQRAATATEIAAALHTSAANVRHHLAVLEQMGLVERVGGAPPGGRGRPAQRYAVASPLRGDNVTVLASLLLEEALAGLSPPEGARFLERLAQRWLAREGDGPPARGTNRAGSSAAPRGGGLTARLYHTVDWLNAHHYQARWEARPRAPRLVLHHCPYRALVEAHPELCQFDAYLIARMLGRPVEQTHKLVLDERGLPYCCFEVR